MPNNRNTRMGPPCKQRSQIENWNSAVERLQQQKQEELLLEDEEAAAAAADYNMLLPPQPSTVSNRWDPVIWYSQHGYNVSEMIKAPGTYLIKSTGLNY